MYIYIYIYIYRERERERERKRERERERLTLLVWSSLPPLGFRVKKLVRFFAARGGSSVLPPSAPLIFVY